MLNRKYFPFERNSYYFGKLLTARDFEAEQRYLNDKRRLLNRLAGANGIVSGLGVVMADDSSIIIQSGCAFDASGREIVVPETQVVKLSTIEGYAQLSTNCAYLGISYDEKPDEEVYSVMSDENGNVRHNKVCESYKLTLLDESMAAKIPQELDRYINRMVLYADKDVEVALFAPFYLPRCGAVRVRLQIARVNAGTGEYSFTCRLKSPGFCNEQGQTTTDVAINNVKLIHGESRAFDYTLYPEPYVWGGASAAITVEDLVVRRGDEVYTIDRKLESTIRPAEQSITDFYLTSFYAQPMDKMLTEGYDERLWIAKILLIRQKASVIVDHVLPPPFTQYSYNAQQLMALRRIEEFYPDPQKLSAAPLGEQAQQQTVLTEQPDRMRTTASGVINLSIGLENDQKRPAFSDEIMHGLGKGPVYVEAGIEYITANEQTGDVSEVILGDASIFEQDAASSEQERLYNLSVGVKVLPERGTFVVGVKLGATTGLISLRIRWFAIKLSEINKQIKVQQEGERMILINPDTIVIPPKGTAHISPVFINMPSEPCTYRVLDSEGGTVDQNGLYTAPAREGVYEIRVEAISDPSVFSHVFAIVTQKKKKE